MQPNLSNSKTLANFIAVLFFCGLISHPAFGEVFVGSLFTDNMVLQRGILTPIWGHAAPNEVVNVQFGDITTQATADGQGYWMTKIGPLKVGQPKSLKISSTNTILIKNVVVGDVWICSGQSNMSWPVAHSANAGEEIRLANHPALRLFHVNPLPRGEMQFDCEGSWLECSPKSVPEFSAVGYYFALNLLSHLNIPIGIVQNAQVLTPIESWMSRRVLSSNSHYQEILDRAEITTRWYSKDKAKEKYTRDITEWTDSSKTARSVGLPLPARPKFEADPRDNLYFPSSMFNGVVRPLIPYGIAGIIWYQGEANVSQAARYSQLFPSMINDWRDFWGQGDFPFIFVQLANFKTMLDTPFRSPWAELRQSQLAALAVTNTAMVVTIDIGDPANIHPLNKQEVGRRLALAARSLAYNERIVSAGPIYHSMTIEGKRVHLRFMSIGGGLMAKGDHLAGFSISGSDHKFVPASAIINGEVVEVWNDQIMEPAAVRYGWSDNPVASLYNKDGLPASPFSTDAIKQ